jgi:hypothetical protein
MLVGPLEGPAVVVADLLRDDVSGKLGDADTSEVMAGCLIERRIAESDRATNAIRVMRAG